MPGTSFYRMNCRSDGRTKAMFLVQISNKLQIAMFIVNYLTLIGQYLASNLMGDLMDD